MYLRGRTGELNLTGRNSFRWACGVAGRDLHPLVNCLRHPFAKIGCGGGGGGNGIDGLDILCSSLSRRFGVLVDRGDQIPVCFFGYEWVNIYWGSFAAHRLGVLGGFISETLFLFFNWDEKKDSFLKTDCKS